MTNKPVRHESLGWDRALTVCFAVLAAFNLIAATHYSGMKSLGFNLIGVFAAVSAICIGRGLIRAAGRAIRDFLIAILGVVNRCGMSLIRATGRFIGGFGRRLAAMLPAAPIREIDQLYAEIGQRIAWGEEFGFVYNEQSFRRA